MKQHITATQLQELSDTARDKLTFYLESTGTLHADYRDNDFCEHVNIGRMIEFLDERVKCLSCMKNQQEGADEWIVAYVNYLYKNKDLCDALFEACKNVLEEKDR